MKIFCYVSATAKNLMNILRIPCCFYFCTHKIKIINLFFDVPILYFPSTPSGHLLYSQIISFFNENRPIFYRIKSLHYCPS